MSAGEIRRVRLDAGLTQKQFAEALRVSQQYVHQIETGIRPPSDQAFDRILEVWEAVGWPDRPIDEGQEATLGRAHEKDAPRGPYKTDGA